MAFSKRTWSQGDVVGAGDTNRWEDAIEEAVNYVAPAGDDGESAYALAVDEGFVGSEQDWLDSLVGPEGEQGIPGDASSGVVWNNVSGKPTEFPPEAHTHPEAIEDFATKRLSLAASPATGLSISYADAGPRPLEVFGGYMWATGDGQIYRSDDEGETWTTYCPSPIGDIARRIIPTNDDEVVVATASSIFKSSGWESGTPTWDTKVNANPPTTFQPFSVSGDGTKFIASEYGDRPASRYAHISVDGGDTFNEVWDSVQRFGEAAAAGSHVHGCEYDPWSDRFYLSEGHNDAGAVSGIYVSSDDGATWIIPDGLITDPSPTVMVATHDGLVCGADHEEAGIWGIIRQEDPAREVISRTWAWRPGRAGVIGFGVRGFREPRTGVVYIGFRTATPEVAPVVAGGTAASAGLVYEWPTLPVDSVDDLGVCLLPSPDKIIIHGNILGQRVTIRGNIAGPGSGSPSEDTGGTRGGYAPSGSSVAVGAQATTYQSAKSLAVGVEASTGMDSGPPARGVVAVGHGASASSSNTVVVGATAEAGGSSVAIGYSSDGGTSGHTIALGNQAKVTGGYATSLGSLSTSASRSVAVGSEAKAAAYSVAVGKDAEAGSNQVAVGHEAKSSHANSTAIGHGTVTTSADQTIIGARALTMLDSTEPVSAQGQGSFFVQDGVLKFKGGSGTVTVIGEGGGGGGVGTVDDYNNLTVGASDDSAIVEPGGAGNRSNTLVGGGQDGNENLITGTESLRTILGGYDNQIGANIASGIVVSQHSDVKGDANHASIFGGSYNTITGGNYPTILGGTGNDVDGITSAILSSNDSTTSASGAIVIGGYRATASGQYSYAAGFQATAAGNRSIAFGGQNNETHGGDSFAGGNASKIGTAANPNYGDFSATVGGSGNLIGQEWSARFAAIVGGRDNSVDVEYGVAIGGRGAKPRHPGSTAQAMGSFSSPGDAQSLKVVARRETTNTTAGALFTDGNGRLSISGGATWTFRALIAARSPGSGESGSFIVTGGIQRDGAPGSTVLVGTPIVESFHDTWTVSVLADTTNGALILNCKTDTAITVRWVASIEIAEIAA